MVSASPRRVLFGGGPVVTLPSKNPEELRHLAIGLIKEKHWTVVYALRGDRFRLISARRSPPNEKTSSKNSLAKTTASSLESRFTSGRDILDYFDFERAMVTHGGARQGAGRKPTGKLQKTVKLSPQAIRRF
jgi:hypothetical protein